MDEHVDQQNIESVENQIEETEVETVDEEAEAESIGSLYEDEEAESDDDAAEESEDEDPGDADEGEDDEEQEEVVEEEDPATEPEPEEKPEPVESDESRRNRRLAAEFLKLAKARGYKSVEEMLADETGGSVKEIEDRVSSKEMTDEEKIAAYDKMMAEKKSATLEKEGKAVHDRLLAQIHKEFPETVGTLKNLDKVPNAERFRELVLKKGLTGDEAYAICAAKVIRAVAAKAAKPSGKEHIRPDSRKASGNATAVSSSDMAQYRSMFPDLSDAQIRAMYARTSKT